MYYKCLFKRLNVLLQRVIFIFVLLIFMILGGSKSHAKEIICVKTEVNPGPDGYKYINHWSDELSYDTYYILECQEPGNVACVWPDNYPCSDGVMFQNPIPTNLEIQNDNGDILFVDIEAINEQIRTKILDEGEDSGIIIIEDVVEIYFQLSELEDYVNGYKLVTTILTDSDMNF